MSDPIRAFCDISEAVERATYLKWPELASLVPQHGATRFPGSLYALVTTRVNASADDARAYALASGKVSYETVDCLVSALLTACHAALARHIENGKLREQKREPFSVREPELPAPPENASKSDAREYQSELQRRSRAEGDLTSAVRSARQPLRKLSDTLAACRAYSADEAIQPASVAGAAVERPQPATPKPARKTKGKGIDGRIFKISSANREAIYWPATKWAEELDCAESTVKESDSWKNIMKIRALLAVEGVSRMDRSGLVHATRPNRVRDDERGD